MCVQRDAGSVYSSVGVCAAEAQTSSRKQDLLGWPRVGSGKEENKNGGREEG